MHALIDALVDLDALVTGAVLAVLLESGVVGTDLEVIWREEACHLLNPAVSALAATTSATSATIA